MSFARPTSLRGRLMAIAAVAVLAATLVAAATMAAALQRFVTGQVDQRLDAQAMSLLSGLRPGKRDDIRLTGNFDAPPFDRPNPGWFWQVDVDGEPRLTSGSRLGRPPLRAVASDVDPPGRPRGPPLRSRPVEVVDDDTLHARLLSAPIDGHAVDILVTAPNGAITGPMRDALTPVILSMAALGIGLIAAIWLQVRFGLRPLAALGRELAAIRSGAVRELSTAQPDEIRPLALELNSLLAENAAGLDRARRHVANLAHGLKTPLADLSLSMHEPGRDPDGSAGRLIADMDRRVRHHLARARAAAVGQPARATADLQEHLADLVSVLSRIYAERRLQMDLWLPDGAKVACDAQDLNEMAGNLLDNACKWAKSRIRVTARRDGGAVVLSIEDDGDGLAEQQMPEALMAGRRLDEMRPGHGFGLSITRELAELYGGALAIARSDLGGLAARLTLPVPRS